jgi:hypothetical protein
VLLRRRSIRSGGTLGRVEHRRRAGQGFRPGGRPQAQVSAQQGAGDGSGSGHRRLLWTSRKGNVHHAFTLQNTSAEADSDPQTSDAIFVYTEKLPTLAMGRENVPVREGDHLVVRGLVEEYFGQTQLKNPVLLEKLGDGLDLDLTVPPLDLTPPSEEALAAAYWERLECMRVSLPAGAAVTGPRHINDRNNDSEFVVIRGDHPIALRADAATRRVYRDPHPLDDDANRLFDNGNGFRIVLDAIALKGASGSATTQLPPVRTLDAIANRLEGVILHGEGGHKFATRVMPEIKPAIVEFPAPVFHEGAIRVATYNVENLFDYRNDPSDDSDFHGDTGTQNAIGGVFNYVPSDEAAYQAKLRQISMQILHVLKAPDILLVQEAEDQDICLVKDGRLVNTGKDGADGMPDTLQELASTSAPRAAPDTSPSPIATAPTNAASPAPTSTGPTTSASRPHSACPRYSGPSPASASTRTCSHTAPQSSNPKVFNARHTITDKDDNDPEILFARGVMAAMFEVYPATAGQGTPVDLLLLNNHFASRPDRKLNRRTRQAALVAACAQALLTQKPGALLIAGGDLNVYARPDDPVPDPPSDQLGPLYRAGLVNAYDDILKREPTWAYSYVYAGMAGILDQMFLSPALNERLLHAQYLHINADWSEPSDKPTYVRASDHDPSCCTFAGIDPRNACFFDDAGLSVRTLRRILFHGPV